MISQYDYTYDKNGYIASEKAVESLYGYAWDDKHNGKHEDGRHDDKLPHGSKHNGKHDKDGEYHFQLVETDREFTYDENGRLLSSKEQEENSGLTTYDYTYDAVGNRLSYMKKTQTTKPPNKTDVAESAFYSYNDSNQLVSAKLFDGKKSTTITYTYDDNGNLISEIGAYGTEKVETYYDYTVENRLQAVYDADRLLMAAAYDGDGNRVFQLNYNLHTDEDWKDNSGNGNGNNKDNAGSGNNGNGNSGNNGNGNGNSGNNGNGKGNGNGNKKENSKSDGTDDAGYGNATNAEEHNSQNQSGILFPVAEEISQTETDLIAMIKTTGKEKDYELIEYISNVNTQYTQVLMELNENGTMDAAYTYGVSRLTEDRFTRESNFYLYDPSGNVAGITDQDGYLWQSYRYDAFGNATFGSPQYDNEYTFNAESCNPNIHSQYLRARYYDTVKGNFLTEDSYLGDIRNPLTLNRYSYCIGNPLFYSDPSGHAPTQEEIEAIENYLDEEFPRPSANASVEDKYKAVVDRGKEWNKFTMHMWALEILGIADVSVDDVIHYDYSTQNSKSLNDFDNLLGKAAYRKFGADCGTQEIDTRHRTFEQWLDLYNTPTVRGKGRLVSIPEDRPRRSGDYWATPSWKSDEARYDKNVNYVNPNAPKENMERWKIEPDSLGVIRAKLVEDGEDAIERYVIAVGPRVMDEDYPFTNTTIFAEEMNYGTEIDVILRDSYYNIYFVPAIVGDIKAHTLDSKYADRKLNDEAGIEPESDDPKNGIYQTAVSWEDRTIPDYVRKNKDHYPNGAIVEFLRKPEESIDKELMRTPEFDILGLIVYDK